MSCFAQTAGSQVATHVNNRIADLVNLHNVDLEALNQQITLILGELAENTVVDGEQTTALQNILNSITALQTSVANNATSITSVTDLVNQSVAALESSIQAERAHTDAEVARLESLIATHQNYDDAELRAAIQANVEAIGSESAVRATEIARVEALIAANTAEINTLKTALAANASAISALQTSVADLTATVAANKAEADAKFASVDACLNGFMGAISAASCEQISNAFALGLSSGNQQQGL